MFTIMPALVPASHSNASIDVAFPSSSWSRQTNPGAASATALTGSSAAMKSASSGDSVGATSRAMLTCARWNVTCGSLASGPAGFKRSSRVARMATVVTGYVPKPEGEAALLAGIEEARRRDARLVVVHAMTEQGAEPAYLAEVRGLLADSGVDHELRVLESGYDASDRLVELAAEVAAGLIVIGLRRRSPVGKLILGSNAQRVLLDAPCPVLTVKPDTGRH
jgi:nucleotide-binding universal stress UspA family protein